MTLAERLGLIFDIKQMIRQAIIDKGVEVPESVPFAGYPDRISQIQSSDGNGDNVDISNAKILDDVILYAIHDSNMNLIVDTILSEHKILLDNVGVEII